MRCVHCGKPLGRFRKATGEFCSEEHRNEYRDQIERAALERLLASREKLTSNQKHPAVPAIVAELVQSSLNPLNSPALCSELWPVPPAPACLFPSVPKLLDTPALRTVGQASWPVIPTSIQKPSRTGAGQEYLGLEKTGQEACPTSRLELRAAGFDLCRLIAAQMAVQRCSVPVARFEAFALTADPLRTCCFPSPARGHRLPAAPMASISFAALPSMIRTGNYASELPPEPVAMLLLAGRPSPRPAKAENGVPDRVDELQMLAGPKPLPPGVSIEQEAPTIYEPRPLPVAPRTSSLLQNFQIPPAPMASISFAALASASRTGKYASELPPEPAALLILPGKTSPRPAEAENGVPDLVDELQMLAGPKALPPGVSAEPEAPAIFEFRRLPVAPRASGLWRNFEIPLAERVAKQSARQPVLDLKNGQGAPGSVAARLQHATAPVLPRAQVQPFSGVPMVASTLAPLPVAAVKKNGTTTDGYHSEFAASTDRIYPRLGLQFQALWNTDRSRLVRVYAGVPARAWTAGVRGAAEPAGARNWLAPLNPRARLVPAVWALEGRGSIEPPTAPNPVRRIAGISSNRGVKGGVIVFGLMLGFGLYSNLLNPQPVSATAADTESAAMTGPLRVLQESVVKRAGVHLADDFRTGLHAWEGSEDWSDSWSYDKAGFVHPGRLALYTPSLEMSDYRLEFAGQITRRGLGWVVRAADVKNYIAVKLVQAKTGPITRLVVIRYAVINGKEEQHNRVAFPFEARPDTMYQVRMEVSGNRYSLFVQDRIADSWEDDRLRSGGVGFFSAKGEDARLRWVRLTYQYDWVGRICAALAG